MVKNTFMILLLTLTACDSHAMFPKKDPNTSFSTAANSFYVESKSDSEEEEKHPNNCNLNAYYTGHSVPIQEEPIAEETMEEAPPFIDPNIPSDPLKSEDPEIEKLIQEMSVIDLSHNRVSITETLDGTGISNGIISFLKSPKKLPNSFPIQSITLKSLLNNNASSEQKTACLPNVNFLKSFLPNVCELQELSIMGVHCITNPEIFSFLDLSELKKLFISGTSINNLPIHKMNLKNLKHITCSFNVQFTLKNFEKINNKQPISISIKGDNPKHFNLIENGIVSPKIPQSASFKIETRENIIFIELPETTKEKLARTRPQTSTDTRTRLENLQSFEQNRFENTLSSYRTMLARRLHRALNG